MARNGYKIIVYMDDNPNSPTYMETYEERVEDSGKCPVEEDELILISSNCEVSSSGLTGLRLLQYYNKTTDEYIEVKEEDPECVEASDEEMWVNSGSPYCETTENGVNTGFMIQIQVQRNSNLPNYGEKRETRYKSPECSDNSCAIWDDLQKACHISVINCVATFDGTADVTQIDINPLSSTYNQTRTINKQDSDCENCTQSTFSWVEVGTMCGDDSLLCSNGLQQVSTNSYTVSQKYKTIGSGTPVPMNEYQIVIKTEDDEDCGYIRPQYEWRVAQGQYLCDFETYTKYEMEVQWVSYDSGVTWSVNTEAEPRRGDVIAYDSYDCGKPMYRWIPNGEFVCEDNGDDWKLKIVGSSSNTIVPCNESAELTSSEIPSGIDANPSRFDFGNCVSYINCRVVTNDGQYSNNAYVHFGDYVESIGHSGASSCLIGTRSYLSFDEDSFDNNLRIINKYAFASKNRYSNNTAYLGSNIEFIGYQAFRTSDSNLNTLKIDTVTPPSLGGDVFYDYDSATSSYKNSSLNSIIVPKGCVDAYKEAWSGYSQYIFSLGEEDVMYRAKYGDGTEGWGISPEGTSGIVSTYITHVSYNGHYTSSTSYPASSATAVTRVYLSNSVKEIGKYAFRYFSFLKTIEIPNSVTSIGSGAFQQCISLSSCTLGSGVTTIGSGAFQGCTSLTTANVPSGSIGNSVFNDCTSLTSCTLGNGVTSIGDSVFYNCSGLTSVVCLATTPPALGSSVFYNSTCTIYVPCESLSAYRAAWSNYGGRIEGIPPCESHDKFKAIYKNGDGYVEECDGILRLTTASTKPSGYEASGMSFANIGDCITSIDENAFSGCTSLSSITIPNSVTSIASYAFDRCKSLTSCTLGNGVTTIGHYAFNESSITSIDIPSGTTFIGNYAFSYCDLTSVIIPSGVTSIRIGTFYNCSNLSSCTLGSGVTSIGSYAFYHCTSLTDINIPSGVTSIKDEVFKSCSKLSSITIPNTVKTIGYQAFMYCGLTSITIPDSVTSIADYAFDTCLELTGITVNAVSPPTLGVRVFTSTYGSPTNKCPIYVPAESLDAYKSAWSTYASRIQPKL